MKQKEKECKTMLLALFSSTETLEAYAIVWAPTTYPQSSTVTGSQTA